MSPLMIKLAVLGLCVAGLTGAAALPPVQLCCEYLSNPLGIETSAPRFSWEFAATPKSPRGLRQTAYQVVVASSLEKLQGGMADLWDSGKVVSVATFGVEYAGRKLHSGERAFWRVRTWDQDGVASEWSTPGFWAMGLFAASDWRAKWIGVPTNAAAGRFFRDWKRSIAGPADAPPVRVPTGSEVAAWIDAAKIKATYSMPKDLDGLAWSRERLEELQPAPLLRREFDVAALVKRATVYLCGLGCYELRLNGQPVSDRVLDAAETQYDRRAYYVTYDVTEKIRIGQNVVGVTLGDGWYRQTVAFAGPNALAAFGRLGLIFQMEIEFADGRVERVVSDEHWKCTLDGPLVKNAVFAGELYDARREMPGWDAAGFDGKNWSGVEVIPAPTPRLQSQLLPPTRVVETVKPVALTNPKPGVWVFDMGTHLTGFTRLKVNCSAGTAITLKFADTLDADGTAFQPESLNVGAKAVDTYICRGGGESWQPRFTYHSFRYVQIEGFPGTPSADALEGCFVTQDFGPTLEFACSNDLFNRLHAAFVRTGRENTQGKFTDCPNREKTGWLSHPHHFVMMHNFAAQPFFAKMVDDMEAKTISFKLGDRTFTNVCRAIITGRRGSWYPEGAVATVLVPWEMYLQYGDRRALERHYPFMRDTLRYLAAQAPAGVLDSWLGDWHDALPGLSEMNTSKTNGDFSTLNATHTLKLRAESAKRFGAKQAGGFPVNTPPAIVSTAMFYEAVRAMTETARLLNQPGDAEEYEHLARRIKAGFISAFYQTSHATFGSQTADAMALHLDLLPPGGAAAVLSSLARDISATHRGHFSTGVFGTDKLLDILTAHDRDDLAHTLMTCEDFPSFGLMLAHGSTTTWETWGEAILNRTLSARAAPVAAGRPLSHVQFVGADAWFHQGIAGIRRDDRVPGFRAVELKPHLVRQLDWARARYHAVSGWFESDWRRAGEKFSWKISVPPNATATAHVPAKGLEAVFESGQPATKAAGVKLLRAENGAAVFELQSGEYQFETLLPSLASESQ